MDKIFVRQEGFYKVLVKTITYNQSAYILDTLNGVAVQKTNFPFIDVLIDDNSIDGEQDTIYAWINEYCDIIEEKTIEQPSSTVIIASHRKNTNCVFAIYLLKQNLWKEPEKKRMIFDFWEDKCCYVAMCEGDDYWIDPLKLQKQVDFLESDETLMACCTNCSVVDAKGNVIDEKRTQPVVRDNRAGRYSLRDFFDQSHQYPTLSVVYRNTHRKEVAEKCKIMRNPYMGDWTLWIALLCFGNMYYLDEVTCAYRINPQSLTHDQSKINQRRLGQAQDNFRLIPLVASVLPEEYQDINKRLTKDTAWMWFNLANAHKHLHHYIKMAGCLVMCGLKDPKMLYSNLMHRNKM